MAVKRLIKAFIAKKGVSLVKNMLSLLLKGS